MKIKLLAFSLLLPAWLCGQTKQLPVAEVISGLEKAVLQKDTSLLNGIVAPNFGITTYTWPASGRSFLQIVNRPQQIESIQLVSKEPVAVNAEKKMVTVTIREKNKEPFQTHVFLNANNELLYVDFFDQLFGKNRYAKSELVASVPFTVDEGGSIILTIRLNDRSTPLRFMFDSGADGMAISKSRAEELGLEVAGEQNTTVVGGSMNISLSVGNTVHLDTLKLLNQSIALFEKMREGIDGLIGLNVAKQFITKFDFDEKKLSLYTYGEYVYEKGEAIAITVPNNIPVISGSLDLTGNGYVDGNFAFDTGAKFYLLGFSPFVRKNKLLVGGFKPESQMSTISLGKATPTFNGHCVDFKVHTMNLKNMPVSLQAGSNWDSGADGSLGIKFISRYNFTINLLDKIIHLVPNNRHDLPVE